MSTAEAACKACTQLTLSTSTPKFNAQKRCHSTQDFVQRQLTVTHQQAWRRGVDSAVGVRGGRGR